MKKLMYLSRWIILIPNSFTFNFEVLLNFGRKKEAPSLLHIFNTVFHFFFLLVKKKKIVSIFSLGFVLQ